MTDLQYNKSSVAKQGHDLPAGVKIVRQKEGGVNSPNTVGGEIPAAVLIREGANLQKTPYKE